MAKPAPAKLPFEKTGPLSPDSPALSTDVYSDVGGPFHDMEMVTCPPRIICSPKRTGKTTLVHYIHHKQRHISNVLEEDDCQLIILDELDKGASEAQLRETVVNKLESSPNCSTLVEMMGESEVINRSTNDRTIFVISDADNLSNSALRWLLYNVREVFLNPAISADLRCQIVIEGSFSLESVTTVDSEFHLPQVFPRDFHKTEQRAFVSSGLSKLNALLTSNGHDALWESIRGDKYLIQAICLNLVEGIEPATTALTLNEKNVQKSIETFLNMDPSQEPLKSDWLTSLADLSGHFETNEFELASFLGRVPEEWVLQSKAVKMLTYQGGLIRRVGSKLETRPFVIETFNRIKDRVMQVRGLIESNFALEGVSKHKTKDAHHLIERIMRATYLDQVRTLHVGEGVKLSNTQISIEAAALGQGIYKGTWDVSTDNSISIGQPVWGILWSWEDAPGNRTGEIRTFPVQAVK